MAKKLQLIYYGNPLLRERAHPIKEITPEIRELAESMLSMVEKKSAVGLAANQVGKLVRLFVFRYYKEINYEGNTCEFSPLYVCINPRILEASKTMERAIDPCMSLPGVDVYCERPDRVVFEAQNLEGEIFQMELTGYNARIIFHENDHLNGMLNIDHVSKEELKEFQPQLKKIRKKYN